MDMPMGSGDSAMGTEPMSNTTMTMPMSMVFVQSINSPLFAKSWTPSDPGTYAGTCIFLIVLAILHRVLCALRNIYFCPLPTALVSSTVVLGEKGLGAGEECCGSRVVTRRPEGRRSGFWAALRYARSATPFRTDTETVRAVTEVIISGIGYLLMLAVMTMNVGYFLSVLAGIFVGAFVAGRFGMADH